MNESAELRELARLIFELARREVWLGGKGGSPAWPSFVRDEDNKEPFRNASRYLTWTMSPIVLLGGHRMRVCVSSSGSGSHDVWVFVDERLKYPGGRYRQLDRPGFWKWLFGETWSERIARIERAEGGQTGHVDKRDLLIAEAKERLEGPAQITHEREETKDPQRKAAEAEVEDLMKRLQMKRGQAQ